MSAPDHLGRSETFNIHKTQVLLLIYTHLFTEQEKKKTFVSTLQNVTQTVESPKDVPFVRGKIA